MKKQEGETKHESEAENEEISRAADASTFNDRLYAISYIPGKGQGLIATSKTPKGIRILSEPPVFKVPRYAIDTQTVEGIVIKELKSLSKDQQRAFFFSSQHPWKQLQPVPWYCKDQCTTPWLWSPRRRPLPRGVSHQSLLQSQHAEHLERQFE
jgi:hypothetical protein